MAETSINEINHQDLFLKQLSEVVFLFCFFKGVVTVSYYTNSRMHICTLTQHAVFPPTALNFNHSVSFFSLLSFHNTIEERILQYWLCPTLPYSLLMLHEFSIRCFTMKTNFPHVSKFCWLKDRCSIFYPYLVSQSASVKIIFQVPSACFCSTVKNVSLVWKETATNKSGRKMQVQLNVTRPKI